MAKPGDIDLNANKTVEDILGTKACDDSGMTPEQKGIRVRDIMFSTSATFDPPAGQSKGKQLSGDDWQKIIDATEKRTGWTYKGAGAHSCCCTFP